MLIFSIRLHLRIKKIYNNIEDNPSQSIASLPVNNKLMSIGTYPLIYSMLFHSHMTLDIFKDKYIIKLLAVCTEQDLHLAFFTNCTLLYYSCWKRDGFMKQSQPCRKFNKFSILGGYSQSISWYIIIYISEEIWATWRLLNCLISDISKSWVFPQKENSPARISFNTMVLLLNINRTQNLGQF